jgi:predicted CXXCH cytochrome family protein
MGDKLPKAPNSTKEGRDINNRIEVVVYPADVTVSNSQLLPMLKDREKVLVSLSYQGPSIHKLSVIEKTPTGIQYVRGSGYVRGKAKEPVIRGDQLVWELGDMDPSFSEVLYYVVKKDKNAAPVPAETKVSYVSASREMIREFDPKKSGTSGITVKETCMKCHGEIMAKTFKHGPVDAGYCNLCHDPHASPYNSWLRKSPWDLCTTCHAEKASGVHVVAGFAAGSSHPTRLKPDPSRPGKRLSCSSCHEPHGAESRDLFVLDIKTRNELCVICHQRK